MESFELDNLDNYFYVVWIKFEMWDFLATTADWAT